MSADSDAAGPAMPGLARIGTAGWAIRSRDALRFPGDGTHLQRYAGRLNAVEVNSSFYRPHKPKTYERWAQDVSGAFRFAVKAPKEITHGRRLVAAAQPLAQFLSEVRCLGANLGPLLVQLPPSLSFDDSVAASFFGLLRAQFGGQVVCEPRHATWFTDDVDALLSHYEVARVAADPACVPRAADPGGWPGMAYYRLHGSPRIYSSAYEAGQLTALAQAVAEATRRSRPVWCIFDNTAQGEAIGNALDLSWRVAAREP